MTEQSKTVTMKELRMIIVDLKRQCDQAIMEPREFRRGYRYALEDVLKNARLSVAS